MINLEKFSRPLVKIVENATDIMIMELDPELKIAAVNSVALRNLCSRTDVLHKPFCDLLSADSAVKFLAELPESYSKIRLGLNMTAQVTEAFDVHVHKVESGWLLLSERLNFTASEALDGISQLNNELSNITRELRKKNRELKEAQSRIKTLNGLLPVCVYCKKVRDDEGYWDAMETYISLNSDAMLSHGICPSCLKQHFPEMADEVLAETEEKMQDQKKQDQKDR